MHAGMLFYSQVTSGGAITRAVDAGSISGSGKICVSCDGKGKIRNHYLNCFDLFPCNTVSIQSSRSGLQRLLRARRSMGGWLSGGGSRAGVSSISIGSPQKAIPLSWHSRILQFTNTYCISCMASNSDEDEPEIQPQSLKQHHIYNHQYSMHQFWGVPKSYIH